MAWFAAFMSWYNLQDVLAGQFDIAIKEEHESSH